MIATESKIQNEFIDENTLRLLNIYLDKNTSKEEKKKWDDFCCSGRWTKIFISKQTSTFLATRTIVAACTKVFSAVSLEKEPPIVTAAKVNNIRESATRLHGYIQEPLPYPAAAKSPDFKNGLGSLTNWRHSDCISITSGRGNLWKRWCTYELAREILRGFHEAPDKLISELLSLLFGAVDEAWVRKILPTLTRQNLLLEIQQESAYKIADQIATNATSGIINSLTQISTEEAKEQAGRLIEQSKRLLSGKSRFNDDTEALETAFEAIGCMSDPMMAHAIIHEIKTMISDYY